MNDGPGAPQSRDAAGLPMPLRIAWRNLWRNTRRTALTAGGVAFAVFLVTAAMCLQLGSYHTMKETATGLLAGHLQIQHGDYRDSQRLEDALPAAAELLAEVGSMPGIAAASARVETFALASVGERSFGARIIGLDAAAERQVVDLHERIVAGRHIESAEDAVLGTVLARNLGVAVGDEVVLLGSARQGGVAVLVANVAGLIESGMVELDRSLLLADITAVQNAFDLTDRAHRIVLRTTDLEEVATIAAAVRRTLPARWPDAAAEDAVPLRTLTWRDVLPELNQAIEIDRLSAVLFYWLIMLLVAFSVVNTFIMTVFERRREFGMLLAIGMRPGRVMLMLQWEALFMWGIGTAAGMALAGALVAWLAETGIYLGADMERLASQMYMPARLYPVFAWEALLTAPLVMLAGTQVAAVLPSLRIRRIRPVDALRVAA
ncbi:MAG: FtsX-like permease family protein [Gammaproteobacteria bacterium]|nr:FtsX-like permease family protein [Gammaproteobacteria bacterium]